MMEIQAFIAVVAAVAAIAWGFWRRSQRKLAGVLRITPAELHAHLAAGKPVTIIDLRPALLVEQSGQKLPGARVMHPADAELHLRTTPRGHHLVFYCT